MVAVKFSSEASKAPGWLKKWLAVVVPCTLAPAHKTSDAVAEVMSIAYDVGDRHVSTAVRITPVLEPVLLSFSLAEDS